MCSLPHTESQACLGPLLPAHLIARLNDPSIMHPSTHPPTITFLNSMFIWCLLHAMHSTICGFLSLRRLQLNRGNRSLYKSLCKMRLIRMQHQMVSNLYYLICGLQTCLISGQIRQLTTPQLCHSNFMLLCFLPVISSTFLNLFSILLCA